MNIDIFRQYHSYLIMKYQLIEEKLKLIHYELNGSKYLMGKNYTEYWDFINKRPIHDLIKLIKYKEKELKIKVLDKKTISLLNNITTKRNFWCHQCYLKIVFRSNGESKLKTLDEMINKDIFDADVLIDKLLKILQSFC